MTGVLLLRLALLWPPLSVLVGVLFGQMIRRRDRQVPRDVAGSVRDRERTVSR